MRTMLHLVSKVICRVPRSESSTHSNAAPFSRCEEGLDVGFDRTGSCWVVAPKAGAGSAGLSVAIVMVVKKSDTPKVGSRFRQSMQVLGLYS